MKKNLFFAVAALAAMTFTSCSNEDNPGGSPVYTNISFESQTLNADNYWCGDESGTKTESWGVDSYACTYEESGVTFPVNWMPAYLTWSGFAISSRKTTTFETLFPDQFNSCAGNAFNGNNYCVIYTFGESIQIKDGALVKGFYFTNSAYAVKAILEGDGITPGAFGPDDWFKCTVTGEKADGTTATVDIMLAEKGDYVKTWQFADLSALGKVVKLSFAFTSTKNNDWGITTPSYICIDNMIIEK